MTQHETTIGEYLRELMAGRSQRAWAAELGVGQATVSKWWNGESLGKNSLIVLLVRFPEQAEQIVRLARSTKAA